MYLKRLATNLFMEHVGRLIEFDATESVLSQQLFGGENSFDLGNLVEQLSRVDPEITDKTSSWLADEENQIISPDQIEQALGAKTIQEIASKLEIGKTEVTSALSFMLPKLIDAASRNGSLYYHSARTLTKNNSSRLFQAVSRLMQ